MSKTLIKGQSSASERKGSFAYSLSQHITLRLTCQSKTLSDVTLQSDGQNAMSASLHCQGCRGEISYTNDQMSLVVCFFSFFFVETACVLHPTITDMLSKNRAVSVSWLSKFIPSVLTPSIAFNPCSFRIHKKTREILFAEEKACACTFFLPSRSLRSITNPSTSAL